MRDNPVTRKASKPWRRKLGPGPRKGSRAQQKSPPRNVKEILWRMLTLTFTTSQLDMAKLHVEFRRVTTREDITALCSPTQCIWEQFRSWLCCGYQWCKMRSSFESLQIELQLGFLDRFPQPLMLDFDSSTTMWASKFITVTTSCSIGHDEWQGWTCLPNSLWARASVKLSSKGELGREAPLPEMFFKSFLLVINYK
jgi:hypothetical protein